MRGWRLDLYERRYDERHRWFKNWDRDDYDSWCLISVGLIVCGPIFIVWLFI